MFPGGFKDYPTKRIVPTVGGPIYKRPHTQQGQKGAEKQWMRISDDLEMIKARGP
jgi:hypothetical protein